MSRAEQFERALSQPGARAWLRDFIPTPEPTRPVPPNSRAPMRTTL
jgi:hypothetical protein